MPVNRPPPWLSEHTDEVRLHLGLLTPSYGGKQVLSELGYDAEDILHFRENGIV